MKKVVARGRLFFEDSQGNLILAQYVNETPVKMKKPEDVMPLMTEERTDNQENLVCFTLDGANQVIKKHLVTRGLANQSQCHPREVFSLALVDRACSVLLAHNHPSGNVEPSESDITATKRLVKVGKTMGIPVMDHVIVSALKHLSIRESNPFLFGGM